MKKIRQQKMVELVQNNKICTQEELTDLLIKAGFKTTQATISRDIKELGLIKTTDKNGTQHYTARTVEKTVKSNHDYIFSSSVISISHAVNDIVIKCYSGMANAACAVLDNIDFPEVLGTLAGDDTILVIAKSESDAVSLINKLNSLR
ncbi:MAG: arginine repressor [Clostridia bacterium]|nr:arginine repressor [Clostridia bacterium]